MRNKKDFPLRILQGSKEYPWLILIIAVIIGASFGYLFSVLAPPVYEAKATLTTNMDIKENRPIITEIMVDSQIEHIGEVMYTERIVFPLLAELKAEGIKLSFDELKKRSSIERQLMTTVIKVRSNDPAQAAKIASTWAKVAYGILSDAKVHALNLSEAQNKLSMLASCVPSQGTPIAENKENALLETFCSNLTPAKVSLLSEQAKKVIAEEDILSLGLTPSLNVSQYSSAAIPEQPLHTTRGVMIISGMLIGLILGILINEFSWKKRFA